MDFFLRTPMLIASKVFLLLSLSLSLSLLMAGCHTDTGDPLSPNTARESQIFTPIGQWGTEGYCLDSASSIWVAPTPLDDFKLPGDLAVSDTFNTPTEVSPLASAIVKANRSDADPDARIQLIAFDMNMNPLVADLLTQFAADPAGIGADQYWCRYPTVEVAYIHEPDQDTGYIGFHVAWSQWTGTGESGDWSLFYKFIYVEVNSAGIDWEHPIEFTATEIYFPASDIFDEIQPDLAIDPFNRQMLLTFIQTNEPGNSFYSLITLQGVIHPKSPVIWNGIAYIIPSLSAESQKANPKIDVGLMNPRADQPMVLENTAVVTWTEYVETLDNYQIFYASANPLDPGSITTQQITFSENFFHEYEQEFYESWNMLPSVNIPSPSSKSDVNANMQAVIAYERADVRWGFEDNEWKWLFKGQHVLCQVTPQLGTEFILRGDDTHWYIMDADEARTPEVACYQMNDPTSEYQWFGVAMQGSTNLGGAYDLETWTGAWTYQVDVNGSVFVPNQPLNLWLTYQITPYWSNEHPHTGPTMCLRHYDLLDPIVEQVFALGWVEGVTEPTAIQLSHGTIKIN